VEEWIPVTVLVQRWEAQGVGVLRKRDEETAFVGAPTDLGGSERYVPERNDRDGQQSTTPWSAAPSLDQPVVVGLDAHQREVLVGTLREHLAGEAEQVREAQRRFDMVRVHVGQTLGLLPGSEPDLFVGGHLDVDLLFAHRRD